MKKKYAFGVVARRPWLAPALAVGLLSTAAHAQTAPAWLAALAVSQPFGGSATALATVVDASGNVYVAGSFNGQVQLGANTLVSVGGADVFVAKWNAAGNWAWVTRAGGTDFDAAQGLALSGNTLYLTGYVSDDAAGTNGVTFGTQTLPGKNSSFAGRDLFVAKLTDAGSAATWNWAVNGGGTRDDAGTSVAVSTNGVYVAGAFINDSNNSQAVTFGTLPLNGLSPTSTFNSDVVVAKLTDAGSTGSFVWALAAGGGAADQASALAVSGSSVYAAGYFTNSSANANAVTFGAAGALNGQAGTASDDVFFTKITDAGSSAAFTWARAAGGSGSDRPAALAVSGSSVYAAGYFTNSSANANAVTFGAAGALNGQAGTASQDIFVAKLTDAGSTATYAWAQAAGGVDADQATALAVSGTSLYVGGSFTNDSFNNNAVTFGSLPLSGVTAKASADAVVARLTDAGSTATWNWAQAGGGVSVDNVQALAVNGGSVYPVGTFSVQAGFGMAAGSPLSAGAIANDFYLGQLTEATGGTSASWTRVVQAQIGGSFSGLATATDGNGNVYVTGSFTGSIVLGGTTLTSAGSLDAFVAKWNPATNAWVWALPAGGLGGDQASALAVSGGSVYVGGYITEDNLNSNLTRFGLAAATGKGSTAGQDIFVAKLVDAGASASWSWVQVAGGNGVDRVNALALNGTSVYVAGYFANSPANANTVTFGTITLAGIGSAFSNDVCVAKLTDAGSTGSFVWALASGGTGIDRANALAVNGSSLYLTGYTTNDAANTSAVTFGSTSLPGYATAAGNDVFVAKLTDAGSTATYAWALAAGGLGVDQATAIALNGPSVYVAGYFTNNAANASTVTFGALPLAGVSATSGQDAFVAKLTDAGASATYAWATAGGGNSTDQAVALAASGSAVYVAGNYLNTAANGNAVAFGSTTLPGSGTTPNPDLFLAKYFDAGTSASAVWAQRAGSPATEQAGGLAISGARLYLTGLSQGAVAFVPTTLPNAYGAQIGFAAYLNDVTSPLAAAPARTSAAVSLYPNPAHGAATVTGLPASAPLQVLDLLGRAVTTATADAAGTAVLQLPLAPGVYLVRGGTQALRLTVE